MALRTRFTELAELISRTIDEARTIITHRLANCRV